jgi:hypothetical protein
MRHLGLVLMALLLAVACGSVLAGPVIAPTNACTSACWTTYNAEIQDCVNNADMTRALQPVAGDAQAMALGTRAARPTYAGPQVDVLEAVREQCRRNIGNTKLNTCLKACSPPPIIVRPTPKPKDCMEVCRAQFKPSTLGRLRCMYNCP